MEGLNAYSRPDAAGGITVDVERMMVDLITVLKASGIKKRDFQRFADQTWDEVKVNISIPHAAKN